MTTTEDSNATPGTLKAALGLWLALTAALLGYSIATADPAAKDTHTAESADSHGTEPTTPAGATGHGSPSAGGKAGHSPAPTTSPSTAH